jgi:hypothetical protein
MQPSQLQSPLSRLPAGREIVDVFGVVLFAVFGWSIRGFLFKIPAFSLYFGLASNLAILCYMFAFALFESLFVTGFLILVAAVLPSRFLRRGFSYKGFIVVLVATAAMILFDQYYKVEFFKDLMAGNDSSIAPFVIGLIASTLVVVALLWLARVQPRVQHFVLRAVEQLRIFTYIYIPLGLIGMTVVILRNLR